MPLMQNRRQFLASASFAAAASVMGPGRPFAGEGPPEVTTVHLAKIPGICIAPQYLAEELLRAEGFTDVRYVPISSAIQHESIATGEVDFSLHFAAPLVIPIGAGEAIRVLAGVHPGCFELFARTSVRTVLDLKGRSVGIQAIGSGPHVFLSAIAAYVGLDPARDIDWVTSPKVRPMQLFADGKVDAFLGLPPEPQELRARNIGHVIVNSAEDLPWSQYFCCMLAGNSEFIEKHPIATKRVLRAILKATDICATEPETAARRLVEAGFTDHYDYAFQTLTEVPYAKWREFDPEDTMRFYALRLHEVGMIRSTPQEVIAKGTDWRFLNELKRELKA
jgi:NitT/TauT family transport system substrate-binding protein